jgi:hypothetical protein
LVRRFDAHAAASRPPVTVPWGSSSREGTTTARFHWRTEWLRLTPSTQT